MIQIDNKLLVKLPEGASGVEYSIQGDNVPCITYWYKDNLEPNVISIPPGSWQIVGETKSITEEQAGYLLLRFLAKLKFNPFMTAVQNLHRWMEANNMDTKENYLILIRT